MASRRQTYIKVWDGLFDDPKHRKQMGESSWLFFQILRRVNWKTGTVVEWRDEDEADYMEMPVNTLRRHRRKLESLGYITSQKRQHHLEITVAKWRNPSVHSDENPTTQSVHTWTLSEPQSDHQSDHQSVHEQPLLPLFIQITDNNTLSPARETAARAPAEPPPEPSPPPNPAVAEYTAITGLEPTAAGRERIERDVSNLTIWAGVLASWAENGNRLESVSRLVDAYSERKAVLKRRKPNVKAQARAPAASVRVAQVGASAERNWREQWERQLAMTIADSVSADERAALVELRARLPALSLAEAQEGLSRITERGKAAAVG